MRLALTAIQQYVLNELQKGNQMTEYLISLLVQDFQGISRHRKDLYDRYTQSNVPILNRQAPDGTKVNNKIANDFAGEIIDTKIGYVLGHPIKYSVDRNYYQDDINRFKAHQGQINKFVVRNSMNDKDIELGKMASICGVAGREVYIDKDGNEKVTNLFPWEVIFLTDVDDKVQYALRIYTLLHVVEAKLVEFIHVDFYDSEKITYFIENKHIPVNYDLSYWFTLDMERPLNPAPHVFGMCPVVKVENNEEEMGDFERVLSLIDGYDRTMSDINSEIEQFRLAYMYYKGVSVDADTINKAKQAGGFEIPTDGEIGFITKQINDLVVEHHLSHLEEGINRFAKHVNMSDPNFGGGDSSYANKYKLSALEMKSKILEVKMESAFLRQFEIITSAWAKKGIVIDYTNIYFDFVRNLPVNILEEADETAKLKGLVSERTRLERLSFVDDVDYEIDQMEQDNERLGLTLPNELPTEQRLNLDNVGNGDNLNGEKQPTQ